MTSFEELLKTGCPDFNPHVVARARRRFSSQMLLAIQEQGVDSAVQVYEQTLALPCTATEAFLNIEGYQLNGPWQVGNDNIIICFKGTVPHLLKALTPKEISRGKSLFDVLKDQAQNPFLTSFEIQNHDKKTFMIMPYYPSTLEHISKLSVENGHRLFVQVGDAIIFLHSLNYNHMDIKPANICVRENGDFVLIDLGSVAMKQDTSESTVVYVPRDFQPRDKRTPNNKYKAVDVNDWLMLGMTIAEKVYGLEVGGSGPSPTVNGLVTILETDGVFGELIGLIPRDQSVA
jgi:serine/threonine protein kinase